MTCTKAPPAVPGQAAQNVRVMHDRGRLAKVGVHHDDPVDSLPCMT
jgi:hypothetical protein